MITVTAEVLRAPVIGPRGGAVVICNSDDLGKFSALLSFDVLFEMPELGEAWCLSGTFSQHPIYGGQLHCKKAYRTIVCGEQIVRFLAGHHYFKGIGKKTAQKLWDAFGERLESILDNRDIHQLKNVIGTKAFIVIAQWHVYRAELKTQWFLQKYGVSPDVARNVHRYYNTKALDVLTENPYRLIAFANWDITDGFANAFNISKMDERRLIGSVDWALSHAYKSGNTAVPEADFFHHVAKLLKVEPEIAQYAVKLAIRQGRVCLSSKDPNLYQAVGICRMEQQVASRLKQLKSIDNESAVATDEILKKFQLSHRITLTEEQCEAVRIALASQIVIISGGAGCGKTTVLKAIFACLGDTYILQLALTGRATLRMKEVTGRDAHTIAYFLMTVKGPKELPEYGVMVIDECSMVDLPSIYSLLKRLPPNFRLILIGDDKQLAPIGPGLVFHKLIGSKILPNIKLTQNRRGIAEITDFSMSISAGKWDNPPVYEGQAAGIYVVPIRNQDLIQTVVELYLDKPNAQIISPLRQGGLGSDAMNIMCHSNNKEQHHSPTDGINFYVGEPVVFTENDWSRSLSNGSLGIVKEVYCFPVSKSVGTNVIENVLVIAEFDGRNVCITLEDLTNNRLEHAYAISVHRAQGSEFSTVIIPIVKSRILDLPMLYTAVTRAKQLVILVGDIDEAQRVVEQQIYSERHVGFTI